ASVDVHRATSTNFFKTARVPDHRGGALSLGGDRVTLNHHQAGDHVRLGKIGDLELFELALVIRGLLAPDPKVDCPGSVGSRIHFVTRTNEAPASSPGMRGVRS